MKKYRIYNDTDRLEIVKLFVNKQLEKYDKTYDDVIKKPYYKVKGENVPWYEKYTFKNEAEYNNWRDFCVTFLAKKVTPKLNKDRINIEFSWFNLAFGLKQDYKCL